MSTAEGWGYKGDEESRMSLDDVSHLFPNHALRGAIRIEADRIGGVDAAGWNDRVTIGVEDLSGSKLDKPDVEIAGDDDNERLVFHVKWSDAEDDFKASVTDEGLL